MKNQDKKLRYLKNQQIFHKFLHNISKKEHKLFSDCFIVYGFDSKQTKEGRDFWLKEFSKYLRYCLDNKLNE